MTTASLIPAPSNTPTVLLDTLLLDAELELEAAELETLSKAVAEARRQLVRHGIEHGSAPIELDAELDPDTVAPMPTRPFEDLVLAERLARIFHARYEELAPSFGYRTRSESAKPWEELSPTIQQLMIATSAAVLQDLGISVDPRPAI